MEILVVLIPISMLLIGIAAALFVWAVNNKQFDQLERHGLDIFEEESGDQE